MEKEQIIFLTKNGQSKKTPSGNTEDNFNVMWKFLEESGYEPSVHNEMIRSICPIHNGQNTTSFMYNPENGTYRCWSCGAYGKGEDIGDIKQVALTEQDKKASKKMKKKVYNINNKTIDIYRKDPYVPAILSRCSDKTLVDFAEIGYLAGEIMFPYFDKRGELLGYKIRMEHKKSFYSVGDIASTFFMFKQAYPLIKMTREIVITEGEWDALKCWDAGLCNAVAVGGCILSQTHIKLLFENVSDVVLFLDNDSAGVASTKKMYNILKRYFQVYVVDYKEKDPDKIESREMLYNYYLHKEKGCDWERRH